MGFIPTIGTNRLIGVLIAAAVAASITIPATAGAYPATEPAQFGPQQTKDVRLTSSNGLALRRDGSKAVPFVADLGSNAPATTGGFDWGDAAIGAGAVSGAIALGLGGVLGLRRLKASPDRGRMPAATSS